MLSCKRNTVINTANTANTLLFVLFLSLSVLDDVFCLAFSSTHRTVAVAKAKAVAHQRFHLTTVPATTTPTATTTLAFSFALAMSNTGRPTATSTSTATATATATTTSTAVPPSAAAAAATTSSTDTIDTTTTTTSTTKTTTTTTTTTNMMTRKPRILCLHGMSQSGSSFSQKIGGARRKLARVYDLDFLDGPVELEGLQLGWWIRNEGQQQEQQKNTTTTITISGDGGVVETPFEYVRQHCSKQTTPYDAVLGFSQGGLLATALCLSGDLPHVKAVVTAGAPYVENALNMAYQRAAARTTTNTDQDQDQDYAGWTLAKAKAIPKLHFAGETDAIISVERVQRLSEEGGNGRVLLHEKGHLFPTKAAAVNEMISFLERHVL